MPGVPCRQGAQSASGRAGMRAMPHAADTERPDIHLRESSDFGICGGEPDCARGGDAAAVKTAPTLGGFLLERRGTRICHRDTMFKIAALITFPVICFGQ